MLQGSNANMLFSSTDFLNAVCAWKININQTNEFSNDVCTWKITLSNE